ncbi:hypothetical protein OOK48_35140 [Streptomyces viridodiastaticus]|uniref:hypothetical protein n=1 Tax=Streptomyces albogriseolus TaxID=1887 RepID=UPI002256A9C2|nr:hypothetical protein [Streptomyces viridodiastaticus]MCX4571558.1 hypothetical protein [Streptomyces viridodiastaticus]
MTTTPFTDAPAPFDDGPSVEEVEAFRVVSADAVLAGRAMSSGEFLAGLIASAMLEQVGRPDKLPSLMWSDQDPAVVQEIWQLALAVGLHAGRRSSNARLYRDELDRVQGALRDAGFHAMAGLVSRSRRLVAPEGHPVDVEQPGGH